MPLVKPADDISQLLNKVYQFKARDRVSREAKSLLSKSAQLAIDGAIEAFTLAQAKDKFTENDRLDFPIYIASEAAEHNLSSLDNFLFDNEGDIEESMANLGKI